MRIHFVSSTNDKSRSAFRHMTELYGQAQLEEADCLVVLSGDGMMLRALHETSELGIPIYGMNCGEIGFLTNVYRPDNLLSRIKNAIPLEISPLKITATRPSGETFSTMAVNELYLLRESHQAAKIRIKVNEVTRIDELICDGIIAATAIGSTAYNYSAGGPIIPVGTELMALTPISPFRPRGWRGALLPSDTVLDFEIIDHDRRSVCAVADYIEFRHVCQVRVLQKNEHPLTLLFDADNLLKDKFLSEQFAV
ncbi:MAG: NAD kinase [Holosporaceae bacterium]|jgi:NAD+ kinase|nr:NAD kinase [Holosporaceae bacterium]